jgi:basic amino acid/polyamine antiporter, APA family
LPGEARTVDERRLARRLGVFGATMLGLGSIVGTGIFVSIGIAAGVAGPAVILAIGLAAVLAACNALSSAQLAARWPVSGGTYEYGYRLLHPALGFTAGWMFLCAKTASAATAAMGAAGYGMHLLGIEDASRLPATAAAIAAGLMLLVLGGLRRSSLVNVCIVSVTLLALAAFALAGLVHVPDGRAHFEPFFGATGRFAPSALLYATALMFVAYTGYARIATMGEEVVSPRRTIPRAIVATLVVSGLLYTVVAVAAIAAIGSDALAGSASERATPLEAAAAALAVPGLTLVVAIGAVTAMLGVLLNLILGLSRMVLAMGRRRDLPPAFGALGEGREPRAAIAAVGIAIAALALTGDVQTTWAFSAFTVLVYYAITNLAALRLPRAARLYPPFVAWLGLGGCLFLTPFLPTRIWLTGTLLIAGGLLWQRAARGLWPAGNDAS